MACIQSQSEDNTNGQLYSSAQLSLARHSILKPWSISSKRGGPLVRPVQPPLPNKSPEHPPGFCCSGPHLVITDRVVSPSNYRDILTDGGVLVVYRGYAGIYPSLSCIFPAYQPRTHTLQPPLYHTTTTSSSLYSLFIYLVYLSYFQDKKV